jgi:RNA polymerase sigma-70 factor (ECF subfamily)
MSDSLQQEIVDFIPTLRKFAMSLSFHNADDLVSMTVVRALEYLHTFEEGSNLKAWLMVILRNATMNEFRREKVRNIDNGFGFENLEYPDEPAARENQEAALMAKEVFAKIDKLPPKLREMMWLITVEGRSYEEVAEIQNMNIGTVKSRLSRTRKGLRDGTLPKTVRERKDC